MIIAMTMSNNNDNDNDDMDEEEAVQYMKEVRALDLMNHEYVSQWKATLSWARDLMDRHHRLEQRLIAIQGYSVIEKLAVMVKEIDSDWKVVRRVLMTRPDSQGNVHIDEKTAKLCEDFPAKLDRFNVEYEKMYQELKTYSKRVLEEGDLR